MASKPQSNNRPARTNMPPAIHRLDGLQGYWNKVVDTRIASMVKAGVKFCGVGYTDTKSAESIRIRAYFEVSDNIIADKKDYKYVAAAARAMFPSTGAELDIFPVDPDEANHNAMTGANRVVCWFVTLK